MCHTMLVGGSNEGKSVFLERLEQLLDTAVPGYAVGWALDSPLGFQKLLSEQPNRLTIGDEKGSILMAGNTRRSSSYEVKAYSDFRGMLDGKSVLKTQISKKDPVAMAKDIYVTCAMTTTERELLDSLHIHAKSRFDGITRRFFVFRAEPRNGQETISFADEFKPKMYPSTEAVAILRRLSCQEPNPITGEATAPPKDDWVPSFTQDVNEYGSRLINTWNAHGAKYQDDETFPLFNRALTDVRRFAIFLSAIDGRHEVSRYDVEIGFQWAQFFYTRMIMLLNKAEIRVVDQATEVVIEALRQGEAVDRTWFHHHPSRSVRRLLQAMDQQKSIPIFLSLVQERTNCLNTSSRKDSFRLILKGNIRSLK